MHVNEKKKSNKLNCVSVKQTIKIICFKMIINMYMAVLISRWRFIKGKMKHGTEFNVFAGMKEKAF